MAQIRNYPGMDLSRVRDVAVRAQLLVADLFLRDLNQHPNLTTDITEGGSGGAPTGAAYVVLSLDGTLTDERTLSAGTGISISDGGPGGSVTIGWPGVTVRKNTGADVGQRRRLNFIEGANIVLTVADDSGSDEVDITITSSGSMSFAVPAITYGTAYVEGVATTAPRTDATLKFPNSLMSDTSATLATLTDGVTTQTLTFDTGVLHLVPGTGIDIDFPASTAASLILKPNSTTAAATTMTIQGRMVAGSRTLLAPSWFGATGSDIFSGQTFRGWDSQFSSVVPGQITSCTFVLYDGSTFGLNPSASSGSGNNMYALRMPAPTIQSANATWAEVATGKLTGMRRSISTPTITDLATLIIETPAGAVDASGRQIGLLIRPQSSLQLAATDHIGVFIAALTNGTNRYSTQMSNTLRVSNPSGIAQSVLELRQLNTGATAGAHINLDDKAGDPPSPVTGDLWRNGAALNYRKDGSTTVDLMAGGGGDNITVNGTAATDADFDDSVPAAPTDGYSTYDALNVRFQIDTTTTPDSVSAYLGKHANGQWLIGFSDVGASAVNYIGVRNALTGALPAIVAVGTDTDISLALFGKGAGRVFIGDGSTGEPLAFIEQSAPATPGTNELSIYSKASGAPSSALYAKDDAGHEYEFGLIKRISGNSGAAGPNITWQILTSNSSDNTSTTPAVVMSTTGVGAGTWHFRYVVCYQTAATGTGIKFAVNHTGTVTKFRGTWTQTDGGNTAANFIGQAVSAQVAGNIYGGSTGSTLNAAIGLAAGSVGVSAANTDIQAVVEGIVVISASGTLELKIGTEVAASAVRLIADSFLELKRIA